MLRSISKAWNFTLWQCDAVALGIEEASDLLESAVPFDLVFDGGRLHEEGVASVLRQNLVEALLVKKQQDLKYVTPVLLCSLSFLSSRLEEAPLRE